MSYDLVTVGEILAEILCLEKNQSLQTPGLLQGPFPSGAPAIMIDQAARQGVKTALVAKVGDDAFGRQALERLQSNHVDVSMVQRSQAHTTGTAFVSYADDGERQFIFHFTHAACGQLTPDDLPVRLLQGSKILHIMGCSITGSPGLQATIRKALSIARDEGVQISFDPNVRPELLQPAHAAFFDELFMEADYLLTGKTELAHWMDDLPAALQKLLAHKERVIVLKDGSRGAQLYTRDRAFQVASFPAIERDPTGAGDSFDGSFLAASCQHKSLEEALLLANAAGALAVEAIGPMEGNSSPEALAELIAKHQEIRVEEAKPADLFKALSKKGRSDA